MNTAAITRGAYKLAGNAKDGELKHKGVTYALVFDRRAWVYNVSGPGFHMATPEEPWTDAPTYNTKKITEAKALLREFLDAREAA